MRFIVISILNNLIQKIALVNRHDVEYKKNNIYKMQFEYGVFFIGTTLSFLLSYVIQLKKRAICRINKEHNNGVLGNIKLTSFHNQTIAKCDLNGLSPGFHGLHVHEKADFSEGCASTCSHYNPENSQHGGPTGPNRHKGDFGNIYVDKDGKCNTIIVADVKLNEIINKSFIIHEDEDDIGKGGDYESTQTGNSGKRIACGKIVTW